MRKYKWLVISTVTVGLLGLTLVGCTESVPAGKSVKTEQSKTSHKSAKYHANSTMSFQTAKREFKYVYKLAYIDPRIVTSDTEEQYISLGFYRDGKLVERNNTEVESPFNGENTNISEITDTKVGQTPYVIVGDRTYYVHRQPYTMYNQSSEEVSGTVTDKIVN